MHPHRKGLLKMFTFCLAAERAAGSAGGGAAAAAAGVYTYPTDTIDVKACCEKLKPFRTTGVWPGHPHWYEVKEAYNLLLIEFFFKGDRRNVHATYSNAEYNSIVSSFSNPFWAIPSAEFGEWMNFYKKGVYINNAKKTKCKS
jgi:hypothetical protein